MQNQKREGKNQKFLILAWGEGQIGDYNLSDFLGTISILIHFIQ